MPKIAIRYINIILSSNPCPICIAAQGRIMTLAEWRRSPYGLTDSKKRYCNTHGIFCHCILVPEHLIDKLPAIGKRIKLRGDEITDIKPIVEIHPNEEMLKNLMDEYNLTVGKLPPEIYEMPLNEVAPYLRNLLRGPGVAGGPKGGLPVAINQSKKGIMKQFKKDGNEHGSALDKNGNILLAKSGDKNSIKYTSDEMERMRGAEVQIHNHPSGGAFSKEDLQFYSYLNVKKGIIVTDKYVYEISPKKFWGYEIEVKGQWLKEMDALDIKYALKWEDLVKKGMDRSEATKLLWPQHTHEAMTNFANKYGYDYSRKGK